MTKPNQAYKVVYTIQPLESESHSPRTALPKQRAELKVQKVKRLNMQIEAGTYHVSTADIVRGIVRNEIARLLTMAHTCSGGM